MLAEDRHPVAMTRNRADHGWPSSVPTVHGRRPRRRRPCHPGVEPDVASEIEPIGHVVEVRQDLGLTGVALGPLPLLLELVENW